MNLLGVIILAIATDTKVEMTNRRYNGLATLIARCILIGIAFAVGR